MPLILVIVGVLAVLGVGFAFIKVQDNPTVVAETAISTTETSVPEINTTNTQTVEATNTTTVSPAANEVPEASQNNSNTVTTTNTTPTPNETAVHTAYKNGTYSASGSYIAPGRSSHTVNTTVTITNDIVTASTVNFTGDNNSTSKGFQSKFAAAFQTQVVGKKISDIKLSRVGGASLTTGAFNTALAEVKTQAQS